MANLPLSIYKGDSVDYQETERKLASDGDVTIGHDQVVPYHITRLDPNFAIRVRERTIAALAEALPRTGEFDATFKWSDRKQPYGEVVISLQAHIRKPHVLPKKRYVTTATGRIVEADPLPNIQEMPDRLRGGRVGWYPMTRDNDTHWGPVIPQVRTINTLYVAKRSCYPTYFVTAGDGEAGTEARGRDLAIGRHVEYLLSSGVLLANVVYIANGEL